MKTVTKGGVTSVVAQTEVIIPDLTIKDLLTVIPSVRHSLSSLSALALPR
jgi:omega-6 fatty acid desaturase (delta-12 desaturase)